VLVSGGATNSGLDVLASAEIYDPALGTWSPTGSMSTAHYVHTATLLPDGRVLVSGARTVAASVLASAEIFSQTPINVPFDAFLHGIGPNANPPTLFLDDTAPTAGTAKYKDSAGVKFAGGNLWKEIGTWSAAPAFSNGTLTALSDLHGWVGLKNSDDQGTRFDLRAEVYKDSALVASGETYCITGVTRNPNLAQEVLVPFDPFPPEAFNGTTEVLNLRILTRIGTDGAGAFCGGHSNAVGLRLYFDAATRPSAFDGALAP
jgi:hypothetical protein